MAAGKPTPMATEKIQEMLEENFRFIKAIAEQQNLGRVQEVNQYQQKLQENLMLLAAVADAYSPAAMAAAAATGQAPAAAAPRPAAPAAAPVPGAGAAPGGFPGGMPPQQQQPFMGLPGQLSNLTPQQAQQVIQLALARQQQQQQAAGGAGFQLPGLNLGQGQ